MSKTETVNEARTEHELVTVIVSPSGGAKQGILLVEHDAPIRDFFCEALACRGIPVWPAGNVAEALDIFHQRGQTIRVVVVDQDFTEWNGALMWDVLHRLNPNVKGCLITGDGDNWTPADLAKLGIAATFPKPLQIDAMFQILEALIGKASVGA